jgi:sarcosine oxidase subunit alpha
VLRIEKGHPVAAELNGQTTALMLGLGRMVSTKKDAIGSILSERESLRSERRRLIGLMAADAGGVVTSGAHLFSPDAARSLDTDQGWISSACWSPHLDCAIGLGFLEDGDQRHGEIIIGANPLEQRADRLRITDPVFIDPQGVRTRA